MVKNSRTYLVGSESLALSGTIRYYLLTWHTQTLFFVYHLPLFSKDYYQSNLMWNVFKYYVSTEQVVNIDPILNSVFNKDNKLYINRTWTMVAYLKNCENGEFSISKAKFTINLFNIFNHWFRFIQVNLYFRHIFHEFRSPII